MHDHNRLERRAYRPRYLRPAVGAGVRSIRSDPPARQMACAIAAIIMMALCVGFAADVLAGALAR